MRGGRVRCVLKARLDEGELLLLQSRSRGGALEGGEDDRAVGARQGALSDGPSRRGHRLASEGRGRGHVLVLIERLERWESGRSICCPAAVDVSSSSPHFDAAPHPS